jgi:hypothetical protein
MSGCSLLDEIVRDGARQMLAAALLAEVAAYIEGRSTHPTWSHWSAPVPDSTSASSSNAPGRKVPPNKPCDTPIYR